MFATQYRAPHPDRARPGAALGVILSHMALHTGSSEPTRAHHSNPLMSLANPAVGDEVYLPEIALADDPVPPDVAYQLIKDELLLDGSARLNWRRSSPPGWNRRLSP